MRFNFIFYRCLRLKLQALPHCCCFYCCCCYCRFHLFCLFSLFFVCLACRKVYQAERRQQRGDASNILSVYLRQLLFPLHGATNPIFSLNAPQSPPPQLLARFKVAASLPQKPSELCGKHICRLINWTMWRAWSVESSGSGAEAASVSVSVSVSGEKPQENYWNFNWELIA